MAEICKRLLIRGSKLFVLFTALNLIINITGVGNPNKASLGIENYFDHISQIYIYGNQKQAAFLILLPISYVLMISPLFIAFKSIKAFTSVILSALIVIVSILEVKSNIINLGLVGLVGLLVGLSIHKFMAEQRIQSKVAIVLCLSFVIATMQYFSNNTLGYATGILILIKLFYDLAKSIYIKNQIAQWIILFGQYSLLCYILQIVFLQGLMRMFSSQKWGMGYETISIFMATNIFLLMICFLIRFLRTRFKFMDKSYKLVFA